MVLNSYIEFSGYKGYHVWIFWINDITLERQKAFFNNVLNNIEIPAGLHIEKFPISDDKQILKLPLSRHSIHGKQAKFVTEM